MYYTGTLGRTDYDSDCSAAVLQFYTGKLICEDYHSDPNVVAMYYSILAKYHVLILNVYVRIIILPGMQLSCSIKLGNKYVRIIILNRAKLSCSILYRQTSYHSDPSAYFLQYCRGI